MQTPVWLQSCCLQIVSIGEPPGPQVHACIFQVMVWAYTATSRQYRIDTHRARV